LSTGAFAGLLAKSRRAPTYSPAGVACRTACLRPARAL